MDILDEQIPMAVFPSPRPSLYTERNGEGFVDDVTLWETSLTSELREVQERMQAKAQAWEQGVHVAGGALSKFAQDYLLRCQLELLKEWPACYEDYKQRS
jgi:hypothetical protein